MFEKDDFIPVCEEKDLELGALNEKVVHGIPIALIRYEKNGELFVVCTQCPHEGRPLTELNGYYLCCQAHGLCFDVRTGELEGYPTSGLKLKKFDWKIESGKIWVRLK
ncbi:MAG: Rieske 2Fe-2S domain-containing protein [Candidatus Bathyarchaeia archaeon]